jgi:hypothetical protein
MSLVLRPLGLSLACLGLSFACATAQDDPFLQGTGGRIDTAGKGGGGATAGTAGQTGKGGTSGKGGTGGSSGAGGKGGAGGTGGGGTGGTDGGGGDPGSSGADAGGMGGAPGPDPCAPEGTPPEIHVLLWNQRTSATAEPEFKLQLLNDTDDDVPLSELSVRYYFTSEFECAETIDLMEVNVTYAQAFTPYVDLTVPAVTKKVVALEDHGNTCDAYFELGFVDTTPVLDPGDYAELGLYTRLPIDDGTARDQANDFSFGACSTKFAWWDLVTVYRDGVRVSGTGPDNDSGEGGAGGQGGQGGLGGAGGEAGDSGGQGGIGGSAGTDAGGAGGEGGVPSEGGGAGESAGGSGGAL